MKTLRLYVNNGRQMRHLKLCWKICFKEDISTNTRTITCVVQILRCKLSGNHISAVLQPLLKLIRLSMVLTVRKMATFLSSTSQASSNLTRVRSEEFRSRVPTAIQVRMFYELSQDQDKLTCLAFKTITFLYNLML